MALISRCPGHLQKAGLCLCSKDRTWGQVPDPTFLPSPEAGQGGQGPPMGVLSCFTANRHPPGFTPTAAAQTDLLSEGHWLDMPWKDHIFTSINHDALIEGWTLGIGSVHGGVIIIILQS